MSRRSIESLYGGYVPQSERMITDKEEKMLRRAEIEACDKLRKHLNNEEIELLEQYTEKLYEAEERRVEQTYIEGFSFGMRLAIEALLGD